MERVLTLLKSGGLFYFFLAKTIAKKTIQMDFLKNIFAKKWAFSGSMAEKIFFLWRAFLGAMEVVHV